MNSISKIVQSQYDGYIKTPLLWKDKSVLGLTQFEIFKNITTVFNDELLDNLRLGKRVERFVSHELNTFKEIQVLSENIQVQYNKRTVGEIDCLLKRNNKPIHLEIVYKFYLYDHSVGITELDHWIGPNRNDTLIKKLTKLKEKQLPLLYSEHTKTILDHLELNAEDIKQYVYFKAQLFIPYNTKVPKLKLLNKNCVKGFYVSISQLKIFKNCKFYIPSKLNWLIEIQTQTPWLNFDSFSLKINTIMSEKKAPLCWLKQPNGEVQKFFVVWWM